MRFFQPERMIIVDELAPSGKVFFLDLGCACGHVSDHLIRKRGAAGVGLDVNPGLVREAYSLYSQSLDFVVASGTALPFESESFDLVLLLEVLEHVPEESKLLDEVWRVLTPGGWLVCSVPNRSLISLVDLNRVKFYLPTLHRLGYQMKHRGSLKGYRRELTNHRHYTLEDLKGRLGNRFEVARQLYSGTLAYVLAGVVFSLLPGGGQFDRWREKWLAKMFLSNWGKHSANLAVAARKVDRMEQARGPEASP